jgi:hypothetical protein
MILGLPWLRELTGFALPRFLKACVICSTAMLLSKGVMGMSPQSTILAQF